MLKIRFCFESSYKKNITHSHLVRVVRGHTQTHSLNHGSHSLSHRFPFSHEAYFSFLIFNILISFYKYILVKWKLKHRLAANELNYFILRLWSSNIFGMSFSYSLSVSGWMCVHVCVGSFGYFGWLLLACCSVYFDIFFSFPRNLQALRSSRIEIRIDTLKIHVDLILMWVSLLQLNMYTYSVYRDLCKSIYDA